MTTDDLELQLSQLRDTVNALQSAANAQPRVSLAAVEASPYLGQSVGMTLTVVNRVDASPLPNVPVTIITTWGALRGEDNLIEGSSIATATGPDGVIRVTLRPHLSLEDNEDQDALESMLAQLSPDAVNPEAALPDLQSLAQQYRWEANLPFRNAVDAYFRTFGDDVQRTAPFRDYMGTWTLIPATVMAIVGDPSQTSAVTVAATIRFRDWLGPWYQAFTGAVNPQDTLSKDFGFARDQASSPSGLIASVFDRTAMLVDNEYGEIGKKIAQQGAQRALDTFVNTGLSTLSVDDRATVGPVLTTGSRALASVGENVVAALGQTHAAAASAVGSVAGKVDRSDFTAALSTKADTSALLDVQTSVAGKADLADLSKGLSTKADTAALQTLQTSVAGKADLADLTKGLSTKADTAALQALQTSIAGKADLADVTKGLSTKADAKDLQAVQTTLATKADRSALDAIQVQIGTIINTKADLTAFQAFQTQTNTALTAKADLNTFQAFQTQTNSALSAKANATDLKTLQTALAGKADLTALTGFQTQMTAALAAKADQAAFRDFQDKITGQLGTKANVTDVQALQTSLATKADNTAFQTFQTQVNTNLGLKADKAAFTTFQTQTNTALQSKVDTGTFTNVTGRISVLEGKIR